jgi:equilibrative nucleoside transporter 1/2/3
VFSIFFILGIGSLLPWNFFINAQQYFMYKLRNVNISGDDAWLNYTLFSDNQKSYESYVEVAAMVPAILFMLLNVLMSKLIIVEKRIIVALCTMVVMFILTVTWTKIDTDSWQNLFFIVSLLSVAIMNAASAVLQGGSCGLASFFPKKYMQTLMAGQGLGGVLASIASIVTISLGSTPVESGFSYFLVALSVLVLSLIAFLILTHCDYYRYHLTGSLQYSSLVVSVLPTHHVSDVSPVCDVSDVSDDGIEVKNEILPHSEQSYCSTLITVFKLVWVEGLSAWFVFTVTLSCFPALTSAIQSVSSSHPSQWTSVYFVPVSCFLLFNLSDFIGRSVSGLVQWPTESNRLLLALLCLLRVAFIPLFLLCNVNLPYRHIPSVIQTDVVPIVAESLLGLTNGYLSTLSMMYAPRRVNIGPQVETAGALMSFFLALGLGTGALVSVLIIKVIA